MRTGIMLRITLLSVLVAGCSGDNNAPGGSGMLEADESIVSSEASGRVQQLLVDEGDSVITGDTLLIIDPTRIELELKSARAARGVAQARLSAAQIQKRSADETRNFASRERDRIGRLFTSGTATQKQLDQVEHELMQARLAYDAAEAGVTTAEAELTRIDADIARLENALEDLFPVAPISGIITQDYVEVGELLAPGRPIVKISRLDSMWVKVYLPAADFAKVKVGQTATIDTEVAGITYDGTVVWTSEESEFTPKNIQTEKARANLVYAVKVRLANNDGALKIGMPVYVTIGE